jgi:adenylate kinase
MDLSNVSLNDLKAEISRKENCLKLPKKNIILLGAPGSGKGTQSQKIIQEFCYCQLSTGDLLREAVKKKTPGGIKAKQAMETGQLVSDDIINSILEPVINSTQCERGIIFDGYPRTNQQTENLERLLNRLDRNINHVFELKVDNEILFDRVEGRRIHLESGRTYHVKYNPPKTPNKDDITGEALIQREDDKKEVIKARYDVYNQKTLPILKYYEKKNILKTLNAMDSIDNIYNEIKKNLIEV